MELGIRAGAAAQRARLQYYRAAPPITPTEPAPFRPAARPPPGFPELDCVRGLLADHVLAAAEQRAASVGVGADRVLVAAGDISDETYLRALAASLGTVFEPLDSASRLHCPLGDDRLLRTPVFGLLPLVTRTGIALVVAPRGTAARRLIRMIRNRPELARSIRFTTAERHHRFVLRHAAAALSVQASKHLQRMRPDLSAANGRRCWSLALPAVLILAGLAGPALSPSTITQIFALMLTVLFLAWLSLRISVALAAVPEDLSPFDLPDNALPVYTVIAALYREAASIGGLLTAIEQLDYPAEKLDVILAVEADDKETLAAIAARKTRLPISVVAVPAGGPRTKPKALNVALPFARGTFTVIYDAEDHPEPGQLRRSLQKFRRGGGALACLQAALCIDNTADGWLTRMSTAEYAGQFDFFLPGLADLRLPLPLGGSSNHFRTATLRKVGGWDAHNVTEDADLGMRLARFGYRCGTISSTTYEEAPARTGAWLRQRTRWFKGWMQTWFTHMQSPGRLLRDLGPLGFLSFQLIVGGNVLAALVHPLFLTGILVASFSGEPLWRDDNLAIAVLGTLYGTTAAAGYLVSAAFGWLGLRRRGLLSAAWALTLTPLHWLLLSLAAWRALCQLIVAPYKWEKTEHGLARNSHYSPIRDIARSCGSMPAGRSEPTGDRRRRGRTTYTCAVLSPRPAVSASG